jgi:hypothetical protein
MPDNEGKTSGPGVTKTPDQAYKSGREEEIQEGSLGADTGGAGVQKSRLPEGSDEPGSAQAGGFANSDDAPDAGTVSPGGSGDASPHAQHEEFGQDSPTDVGEGAKDPAPGTLGSDGPDEVGRRGSGQQSDYDAHDPQSRQEHPKNPSDMGNR